MMTIVTGRVNRAHACPEQEIHDLPQDRSPLKLAPRSTPDFFLIDIISMTTRLASHAGSWYSYDEETLREDLEGWVASVPGDVNGIGKIPQPGARVIIAP